METKKIRAGKNSSLGVLGTIGLLLLGKLKYLLVVFKLLKLKTLFSMLIYMGTYALFYGWKFAIALVYLLFVHEMGHTYAAKKIKLPVTPAIFIPFLGAAIGLKEMPKNAKDEGYLAYMGPLFGFLSYLPAIPLYFYTHNSFFALLIFLGGAINLFNLIPITPLDGGRIVAGISTKLWGLGIVLLLAYSIMRFSFLGLIIVFIGSKEWYAIYKRQKNLAKNTLEVDVLEQIVIKLKQESNHMVNVQKLVSEAKLKISNQETLKILYLLESHVNKIQKNLYLQQLSGILDGDDENENAQVINPLLIQLEKSLMEFKQEVHKTQTYYKTDTKTKVQLFSIYVGLAIVLYMSYHFGNQILMGYPEIHGAINR